MNSTPAVQLRSLLITLCAALALVVAGNSALAIALPDIAAELGADQSELTWIIDAYALTFAALLLTAGLAADRVGRRTVILLGLAVFGAASIASAFSPDPAWFIALRALSGAGAAAIFPVTLSALVDAYPPERRTFAIAVWSGVSSAGAVAGTIVAGALLEAFWWGSVQLVFGGVALALIVPAGLLVAQNRNRRLSADPLAAVWSVLALAGIVFGVIEGPQRGWTDPVTLAAFIVGVIGLAGFVVHQLRSREPSLDVRLFRNRGLAAGSLIVTVQFFASLGLFVLAPQYLQLVEEFTPLGAALALLVIPVGVGTGIAASVVLAKRFGQRVPGASGLLIMSAGFAMSAATLGSGADASIWVLAGGLVVFGVGFGMGITPGTELIIEGLPAERRSVASAVNDITREVGGVLGIAVLSSVLLAVYRDEVRPVVADASGAVREIVESGAGAALGASEALGPAGFAIADAARDAFAVGLGASLWVGAVTLAVGGVVCTVLAPGRRDATASPGAGQSVDGASGDKTPQVTLTALETSIPTGTGTFGARVTEPPPRAPERPTVLCIHGFPDDASTFDAVAARLADRGHRVVSMYLRGYAPSPTDGPLSIERLRDDVIAVASRVDAARPVHLIAHDYGAQVSFAALAQYPGLFRSAVLLSGAHPGAISRNARRHPRQLWMSRYIMFFQFGRFADRRVARRNFAALDRLWHRWSPAGIPAEHRERVKRTFARSMPAPVAMYREGGFSIGDDRIAVPVLFIAGADDGCSLPAMSDGHERYFAAAYERQIWSRIGHFPQLEDPDRTAGAAAAWFERFSAGVGAATDVAA